MKALIILALMILTVSCSTSSLKNIEKPKDSNPLSINLEGFTLFDLAYLDSQQNLIINNYKFVNKISGSTAVVLVDKKFNSLPLIKENIEFRYSLYNIFKKEGIIISKLEPTTKNLIIVEIDSSPVTFQEYESKFNKKINNRNLTIRALNYQSLKHKKIIDESWKININSLGPDNNFFYFKNTFLSLTKDLIQLRESKNERLLLSKDDPRILFKNEKISFSSEDLKPTTEELNLFNPKK